MKLDPINWSVISNAALARRERSTSEFVEAQMALAAPKKLLANLRDIMAGDATPEQKLGEIIDIVARDLRADVCSCFIMRAGEMLELFAARGLPMERVKHVRISVGEGPIGDIAASTLPLVQPDSLDAAQYQPRPETGDGQFRALVGVPIVRGGRVHGVLALQNRLPRPYGEEVVEIMQTVAMVLAELIVAGGLVARQEICAGYASGKKPTHIEGASLGRGIAIGTAVLYEPSLTMENIVADNTKEQKMRLRQAVAAMHAAIDGMLSKSQALAGSESHDILEAYQMFAKDRGWMARIEAAIEKGLSAEAAVATVQNETRVRMAQMPDRYIRERVQDLEDLSNRLLSHLMRQSRIFQPEHQPDQIILIARSMGPAALLDYDHTKLKGVILEKGSHSNHVAIVARALGVPVVGQCADIFSVVAPGDPVIIDGDRGDVYIRPSQYVTDLYTKSIEERASRTRQRFRHVQRQVATKDGIEVSVLMNAGLMSEIDGLALSGADGVGLFRTELAFMGWQKYPLVVKQAELYSTIIDRLEGKPVVFRTLDIGGDKPLPYFKAPQEDNPALGWRAIRIGMDRPAVLRTQFRAFIMGAKDRPLKILLPFVTEVAEVDRARVLLDMEIERAKQHGQPLPAKIELGVMLEVPSLLWQLDTLLPRVDFISVGTNDLMQYLFAADRGNFAIRTRYDALSPAMLKVLSTIADKCRAYGKPVSVCGEMAGHPLEAMVLIALGYQSLSVPAQSIENIKIMVPTLDTETLRPYLASLMGSREHSLRERLQSFARDHNVTIAQEDA